MIAALLALGTGVRIGWALVNRQSVVSAAMLVALGSLAALAALNWPPLTRLIDTALGRPNIAVCLSQVALITGAAGSCVMITSVASTSSPRGTRRMAAVQYSIGGLIAAVTVALCRTADPEPELAPHEYLASHLGATAGWLTPLLYVLLVMTLVSWVGARLSNPSRRGRALFIFSVGTALIVASSAYLLLRAVSADPLAGVGTGMILLLAALAMIGAGALLPSVEDWVGARRELRLTEPLQREMERRHPGVGIGIRPRGPLVFRVAERLSLISDALYLEATLARSGPTGSKPSPDPDGVSSLERARAVARWIAAGPDGAGNFPGRDWLSPPEDCSDRDWVLQIARQYRNFTGTTAVR